VKASPAPVQAKQAPTAPAGGAPVQAAPGGKKGRSVEALITIYLEKCYNNVESLR